jgi:hypothetical protein
MKIFTVTKSSSNKITPAEGYKFCIITGLIARKDLVVSGRRDNIPEYCLIESYFNGDELNIFFI